MTITNTLLLKAAEECGEAVQALMKYVLHGPDGKYEDGETNKEKLSKELGDVSTFISILLNTELIDNKLYWEGYDKKSKKWSDKIIKMLEEKGKKESKDEKET